MLFRGVLGGTPNKNKNSFSLIELLVVVALVVLVVTFTVPRTTFVVRFLVQAEINKLYSIFSYLQQRAMVSNQVQELSFDIARHAYRFKTVQGVLTTQSLPGSVRFGVLDHVKGPPSNPTKPLEKAVTFPLRQGVSTVSFLTNGKITPGAVYLVDRGARYLGALTCPISQVSYIRKYAYDGQQWRSW
jgi:type II secretory pathway pseudopilin PulG